VAIHGEAVTPDRSHDLKYAAKPTPTKPLSEIDVTLTPFNRKEAYAVRLYIELAEKEAKAKPIAVTTPEVGVKLIRLPTFLEVLMSTSGKSAMRIYLDFLRAILRGRW